MSAYFQEGFERAFGTWPLKGPDLRQALGQALSVGYRAIDTAQRYENEAEVGETLRASGIPRDELFITTKIWPTDFAPERFLPAVEEALKRLQVRQVDVLLLHWPPEDGNVTPSLRLLQKARNAGLARHVGVSNYTVAMMRTACEVLDVPPVTNQVEFHPLLDQSRLMAASVETGIPLASYCSLARGEIFRHPLLAELGTQYGKSAAQITLRWILQHGVSVNAMSSRVENITANFDVLDFTLSGPDMARIDQLRAAGHRIGTRAVVPYAPDWD